MMYALRSTIQQMISISDAEMEALVLLCTKRSFKRKTFLSDSESYIDEIYFIEKGIIRVMITDVRGIEHTTHFAVENQFIADYSAYLMGEPSKYQLQALEDTETIVMPRKAIEWGYQNLKEGEKLGRLIAEFYFVYLDKRIQNGYSLSPKERYDLMSAIFPNIHNRVPQHMIASYIGVTPVHLSRLKKQ